MNLILKNNLSLLHTNEGINNSDLVIEAVFEDLDLNIKLFKILNR